MPASNITIVGNLGRDPETRYTPNGQMNVQMNVAVSRRFNDSSGQQQERTNWYRVTAWGKLAETMDRLAQQGYLAKGKQVYVAGRFEAREYQDNSGVTKTSLDVTANDISLVGSRSDNEGGSYSGGGGGGSSYGGNRPQQGGGGSSTEFDNDLPDSTDIDEIPF